MTHDAIPCARGCTRWNRHLETCTHTDLHTNDCNHVGCRGCHDDLCNGCEPRWAEHGLLCTRCYTKLTELLAPADDTPESIASICTWLATNLGQHLRSPQGATSRSANPGDGPITVMVALSDLQIALVELARNWIDESHHLSSCPDLHLAADRRRCTGCNPSPLRPLRTTAPQAVAARLRPMAGLLAAWAPIIDNLDHFLELRAKAHAAAPWRGRHPDASDEAAVLLWGLPAETTDQICRRFRISRQWLKNARHRRGLAPIDENERPYRWMPWDVFTAMHPVAARRYEASITKASQHGNVVWSSEQAG